MRNHLLVITICLLLCLTLASCGGGSAADPAESESSRTSTGQKSEQNPDGQADAGEDVSDQSQESGGGKETQNGDDKNQEAEDTMKDIAEVKEEAEVNTDNITINTQSSIRIEGSKTIYIDPFKRNKATHDADIIFITHAHYDHYDEPSLKSAANKDSVIVCPASMLAEVTALNARGRKQDKEEDVIGMKAGEKTEVAEGITVEAVPAYNLNKNFHPKANGWLGYVITMDGVRYYAAGDTDALPELEDVDCDIAFVPVGGTYTMTAREAADLVNRIHPEIAVPIHYGTIVGRAKDADTFKAALDDDIQVVKKVEDAR